MVTEPRSDRIIILHQVLTKDSVTVSVDAVVYYRVSNATISVANVEHAHHSTRLLAQTTLRNMLGTKNLHEILGDRSVPRPADGRGALRGHTAVEADAG